MSDNPRLLIRGARLIDVDGEVPLGEIRDVLIEDGVIMAVEPDLGEVDAEVLDASGSILLPGFVDTHRHTWETQLRGLCGDWTLGDYARIVRLRIAPCYTPEDVYIGNYVGAIEALDAGVTTLLDFSHVIATPEHADAALAGLSAAGIRSLFCYGFFPVPGSEASFESHERRFSDLARLVGASHGDLLEVGAAMSEIDLISEDERIAEVRTAADLGLRQVFHTAGRNIPMGRFTRFYDSHGLLSDRQIHVHCNEMDDDEWIALARAGCKVSISPETELNMGMGVPVFEMCEQHGIKPTLSCDITALCSGEMFTQMRLALACARQQANAGAIEGGAIPERLSYSAQDAIRWATINGAESLGLDRRIGSIAVGKIADVILIDCRELGTMPVHDVASTVVFQSSPADVHTVLVGGRFVKRDGVLRVDIRKSLQELERSAQEIASRAELASVRVGEGMV